MLLEFLTSEAGIGMLGTGMGFAARAIAQGQMQKHQFMMQLVDKHTESADAAAEREKGSGGTWTRRIIFMFVASMFLFLMVAAMAEIPVGVETIVQKGMLFWKRNVVEMVYIDGYFFPVELRKVLVYIVTFYFGQAIKGK